MKYPTMVYRCPGPHQRKGGTFDTRGVKSQEELEAALKDGWFETLPEAIEGKASLKELPPETPPTREELEQKAKELGISFAPNIKDATLAKKISDTLGV